MKANELQKLKKYSVIPVILILIAIALPYTYLESKINEYDYDTSTIDSSIKSAKNQRKERVGLVKRIERYEKLKTVVDEVDKHIPEKKELPDVIDKLSDLAITDDVSINDVRYMNEASSKDFMATSIRLDMKISGKYSDVVRFLTDVESTGYMSFNEEIQMNEGSSAYSVKIRIITK